VADILHNFPIVRPVEQVFKAVSMPDGPNGPGGLDAWWTNRSKGELRLGAEYQLWFAPEYDWRAVVTQLRPNREFELHMTHADRDWTGSRVGFLLEEADGFTQVYFHHKGWPEVNEHFCTSSFCWAMYLRLLKRYVETGEIVPYEQRLDV
jgi:uncharacterized protein YndB with AHSA1/START domain